MTEFQELIRQAIGPNRTQSEFAKEAGITPQYLNRLLNSDSVGRPTKTTLMKISGHSFSGIPLATFMKACGYTDADDTMREELRKMPLKDRINRCVNSIITGFGKLAGDRAIYNNLYEYTDSVLMIYDEEDVSVSIGEPKTINKGEFGSAEKVVIATLSWDDDYPIGITNNPETDGYTISKWDGFAAELDVLICYSETTGGSVIIFDTKSDQKTLMKYHSDVAYQIDTMDEYKEDGVTCVIRYKVKGRKPNYDPNISPEERLLRNIFGDETERTDRIVVDAGLGIPYDEVPIKTIVGFIDRHINSLSSELQDRHVKHKDTLTDETYEKYEAEESYPSYLLCKIIQNETGIRLEDNWDPKFQNNRHAMIFTARHPWKYADTEKELSKVTLKNTLKRYADELGTKVSFCYNTWECDESYWD